MKINSWSEFISREQSMQYYSHLATFLRNEYGTGTCYPPKDLIFNIFNKTPLNKIKVVIVGQDPYHGFGQAMGLSFSVPDGVTIPPSLKNIFKELSNEYPSFKVPSSGNLTKWAEQGVFLLNTTLTVRQHQPMSHTGFGWEVFVENAIKEIEKSVSTPVVYMLWGKHAQNFVTPHITNPNRLVLTSAHPSPFSANKGFFGNRHFVSCNEYLMEYGITPIDWQL